MRRVVRAASPELLCSGDSSYRELEDVYLQTQTKIWLGEVLHMRIDEETAIADLLADGELMFQVSKVVWKMLLKKRVDLKHSKIHIYERTSSGKSDGRYMPYPKVDSFLKVCQILGLTGIDLFSPSDVVEKRDVRRVCMCIRSLSKKSRLQNLDVPDFDKVTYTIAMPTDLVGGIRRNLEQSQCSSSSSNGYIQSMDSRELYRQRSICGGHARYYDSFSESDEADSAFTEPELGSPLSNVAYDATYLSRVVRDRSSDGNLVFDGHLSELQSEFQLERWDGHKEGCSGLPDVLNEFCHSRAVKNNNGKLQEVDYNKSSYPEQRNNQAVSTYFGDTAFVMWPNLDSQSLIKGSFQSSALPFEDSPFKMDELAVSAEDDNGTMLRSKRLNYSVSQCTPFDSYRNPDYVSGEFMKAFKVHSSSSEEASYNTGDNDSVTSECSVTTEEVSGKGCAYIAKVRNKMSNLSNNTGSLGTVHDNISIKVCTMHTEGNKNNGNSSYILKMHDSALVDHSTLSTNKTGLQAETQSADSKNNDIKTDVEVKSLDEVVDTEVVPTPSLNAILDNTFEDTTETKNCTANGFFSETYWLKELELSDENTESSVSELVVSVPGEARNTDLYDTKANEDIQLHESEKASFTADTDSIDWISASEIESKFLFDLGLLQSIFDTQELSPCVKTKILKSAGSFSSTASEKQITPGFLDDLQIDRDGDYVPKVDLDNMDGPFNSETMHIKSDCISCMTAPGSCDQNEGKPSENEAPRILQQINASDDTDLLMGNDDADKNVSATLENGHVTETYEPETREMTTIVDLSEICSQGPNVHDGTESIIPGNVLDATNHSVHDSAYGSEFVGKSQTDVILPCSKPAYMAEKGTSVHKIVELEIPVLPGVNDDRSGIEHKEAEEIDEGVKDIDVDVEFETQTPIGVSSTEDKAEETSKPHPPVKKVLKSIAGGITLFGALFLLLHIKGKRDQEKNSRITAPLQNRNSRSDHVEKGNNARLYPADRLKF